MLFCSVAGWRRAVGDPAELRPYFAELHQIDPGGPDHREQGVWLGTGRSTPWDVLRPRLRRLDVAGSDTPLGVPEHR